MPGLPRVYREAAASYGYVLLWMTVSATVILFNKWLLAFSGFPFPISLTLWHMTFCSAVGFAFVRVLGVVPSHGLSAVEYCRRVMPIGALYAGSLWLSNTAYLHLSVSFVQMTKSLMPALVFAAGTVLGTERFSWPVAGNMALIAGGVVVCGLGEVDLVATGLLQQLAALLLEAMRLTLVQVLMTSSGYAMNPLQSLYYVSPACLACLLLPFLRLELPELLLRLADPELRISAPVLVANAAAALALNLAVFLLIGKTSALTMNIAGLVKDWALVFLSNTLFGAPLTATNMAGYVFCCAGVGVYNYQKLQVLRKRVASDGGNEDVESGKGRRRVGIK
ncbi:unnamed protein product [Ostreobium quekettii]|uniref:Sugar phosphate transporter domain-containing protein n=1 Tax=Ostreobium quekettii TaxID=121088 RepID=A0A8S1JG25_9CHLO|nr:unnamed protein product [Ostreobium quekettii]|eukprot:evm.model.scf_1562.2 EVM.evm.TU.scf_1562.2   scf_1562:2410-4177(-)